MQDEIREKSVALVIRAGKGGAKLTEEALKYAIRQYLKEAGRPKHGKQSIRSLVRQGKELRSIEVTDKNIKSFDRAARKYGVDFALGKNSRGEYIVLFKAGDADALNAAFAEYTAKTLAGKRGRPSLLKQLGRYMEEAAGKAPGREKNEGLEL